MAKNKIYIEGVIFSDKGLKLFTDFLICEYGENFKKGIFEQHHEVFLDMRKETDKHYKTADKNTMEDMIENIYFSQFQWYLKELEATKKQDEKIEEIINIIENDTIDIAVELIKEDDILGIDINRMTFNKCLTADAMELMTTIKATNSIDAKTKGIKKASEILIGISDGNIKLQCDENTSFMVWSIPAIKSKLMEMDICINSTELCRKLCYAKKAENLYPSVRHRRDLNLLASLSDNFVQLMIQEIEYKMNQKKHKNKDILFRIHESGEFYDYDMLTKWVSIANYFKGQNITFMAYTKEVQLLKELDSEIGLENVNIVFKSSIWADTTKQNINTTKELGLSIFTAQTKEEIKESKYIICPNSHNNITCNLCKLCYKKDLNIAIEIH